MEPPLIVIGAHRSGTSVVSHMLATLGVYMGPQAGYAPDGVRFVEGDARLEWNGEAPPFYFQNERLLARAGAAWNRVEPFLRVRDDAGFAERSRRMLQLATFGSLARGYLAPLPPTYIGPWGWKDPRNSLTLPYWLRLFPQARIIHVRRDPKEVAESLHRRALAWQAGPRQEVPLVRKLQAAVDDPASLARALRRRVFGSPALPPPSDPCLLYPACVRLAYLYLHQCFRLRERGACYLELRHERLVVDPQQCAAELAQFAGIAASAADFRRAASLVRR
jgi:hypothetical protein